MIHAGSWWLKTQIPLGNGPMMTGLTWNLLACFYLPFLGDFHPRTGSYRVPQSGPLASIWAMLWGHASFGASRRITRGLCRVCTSSAQSAQEHSEKSQLYLWSHQRHPSSPSLPSLSSHLHLFLLRFVGCEFHTMIPAKVLLLWAQILKYETLITSFFSVIIEQIKGQVEYTELKGEERCKRSCKQAKGKKSNKTLEMTEGMDCS